MPPHSRYVLQAAALLHEIGRARSAGKNPGKHHKRGERLVRKLKPPAGWSDEDMLWLGALIRHHRGRLPKAVTVSHIVGGDQTRRAELLYLVGILRLANALDESLKGLVRELAVSQQNGSIVVRFHGIAPMSREAERIAQARYLLEMVCHRPIVLRMLRGQRGRPSGTARTRLPAKKK